MMGNEIGLTHDLYIYIYMCVCVYIFIYTYAFRMVVSRTIYAVPYVDAVPDIPIYTILYFLTNVGHRVGHQSGLDESSGQIPAAILNVFAFRVYLVFSNIGKNIKHGQILTETVISNKGVS